MADTKQATPELGTCDTPHKLTKLLPSKELSWVQQPHPKSDSCTKWKPLASRSGPDRTPDTVEYWKSRATTAELKVLMFHEEIAKLRSGLDQTPQERATCQHCGGLIVQIYGQWEHVSTLPNLHLGIPPEPKEAGPDRGQQDAPDDYLDAADARFEAEYAPKTDYKWDYDSYIAGWNDAPAFDPQIVEALECADEMERQRRGKSSDSEKQG